MTPRSRPFPLAATFLWGAAAASAGSTLAACARHEEVRVAREDGAAPALLDVPSVRSAPPLPVHEPAATIPDVDRGAEREADVARADASFDARAPAIDGTETVNANPDAPFLAAARVAAARCFTGLPASGPRTRTATITVTVIPTGTVSRAEVRSADTRESSVVECLRGVGQRLKLTERGMRAAAGDAIDAGTGGAGAGLRTYAIEVTVVAPDH